MFMSNFIINNLNNYCYFVELYFVIYLIINLMLCLYYKQFFYNINSFRKIVIFSIIGLIFYMLFILWLIPETPIYFFENKSIIITSVMLIIQLIICVSLLSIFWVLLDYFKYEKYLILELPFIMLMSVKGLFILLISNDLFLMYIAMELQSLALYILAASKRYSNLSIEAAFKYFIFGSFASGIMLFGISLVYGFGGTTNLTQLMLFLYFNQFEITEYGLYVGYLFILVGFLFKLGIVPFHNWIADVYEGVPLIITYFFSVIPKIAILVMFIKVYNFIYYPTFFLVVYAIPINYIVTICALLSIMVGSIGALYTGTIKRLLAYSAIANMGYIMLSLTTLTLNGLASALYFLLIYIFILMNLFVILLNIRREDTNYKLKNIVEIVSVAHKNFGLSVLIIFALFSLAGIPPFIGFFGKLYIFINLIENGFYMSGLYVMLFSILICVYYIRIIRFLWFVDKGKYPVYNLKVISHKQAYLIAILSVLNATLFFMQGSLLIMIQNLCLIMISYF